MDDKNKVYEALAKTPELVKNINLFIKEDEKKMAFIAKVAESKVEAEMSEKGKQEMIETVKKTIEETPCALPDVKELSSLIAYAATDELRKAIKKEVTENHVQVDCHHVHEHILASELEKMAGEKARIKINFLAYLCAFLVVALTCHLIWYFHSEGYWGRQFTEIVQSEYITPEEKNLLLEDAYSITVLPKGYEDNPGYVKEKIRQNKLVIKGREKQYDKNNGKFETNPAIVR